MKYVLTTAPVHASLAQLVFVAKIRWRIERDDRDLKQDFGLGQFESQGWRSFHCHATLIIAAYGFLMAQRLTMGPGAETDLKQKLAQRQATSVPKDYISRAA